MRFILLSLFLLSLPACVEEPIESLPDNDVSEASVEEVSETSDAFICYPDTIAELVGQPSGVLENHPDRPADVRWIGPETLVTQEYMPNRLNVHLNRDGKIIRLACG